MSILTGNKTGYTLIKVKRVLVLLLFFCLSNNVFAGRGINSLPFSESFDSSTYAGDLLWVDGNLNASHSWTQSGWSGGAAQFIPPIGQEGYSGLGAFNGINDNGAQITRINVRFLIYHSSGFIPGNSGVNKLVIVRRTGGARPMLLSNYYPQGNSRYMSYGACDGTDCAYQGGGSWPDGTDQLRIGDGPTYRSREWISMEFEADLVAGTTKLYVYTTDGLLSGLYTQQVIPQGGVITDVDIIGGYFGNSANFSTTTVNNYFMIDELVIDNSYIGPPAGFLQNPPPSAPEVTDVR
ncbi:MAG: hypothetical protein OEZ68_00420 [Gammaproteobacteria bacterium]|nr:hypothetical protein [Gammaproteobacteria bacterium]MDH5799243.1 hypothetical protein [Gammaproteobacteria bacterium]